MANVLVAAREELAAKQSDLARVFNDHPDLDLSAEQVEDVQAKNREIEALAVKVEGLTKAQKIAEAVKRQEKAGRNGTAIVFPGDSDGGRREIESKSIGELFLESDAFKAYSPAKKSSPAAEIDGRSMFQRKALLDTGGMPIAPSRLAGITELAMRRAVVSDLIPQGGIDSNALTYLEETLATNAAAPVAEGAEKPESALDFEEKSANVRKIATVLPVTDELLADQSAAKAYIDNRLRTFITLAEESQVLSGNGTPPALRGLLATSGILTRARNTGASENIPDAIYRTMLMIRTTAFLEPSGIVMHPNDWADVRLMKTTDGIYIFGSPSDVGTARLWGLPVIETPVMTENTTLVGAFDTGAMIFRKDEVSVAISDQHADFFIFNKLMIRAEERLVLVVFRPAAFATATAI